MHSPSATEQRLLAENAELRARLEEAEEALHAIRSGEVDALVVETASGPQVFTLQGLDAESNRFRGEILAQISDAVIVLDDARHVTYLNAAAERQYGVVAAKVLGQPLNEIYQYRWLHRDDEAAALAALDETGQWRGENIHIKHNGAIIHVESSVTCLHAGKGICTGLLAVIRDITERKQAEERAHSNELRLWLALDAAYLISFEWNIQRDEVRRYVSTDPGLPPTLEEAPSTFAKMKQVVHPEDRERFTANVHAALEREDGRYENEFRIIHPDGNITWLSETGRVERDDQGRPAYLVGLSQDVTKRKQAEQALQEADRNKDEFLAMLAHELRNPLAPIRNAVQILRLTASKEPALMSVSGMIERQVNQLVRLVDDLLDVSRVSRGKIQLQKTLLDLAAVIRQAVETSQPLIEARRHTLNVALPLQTLRVEGDFARLMQVVSNLLNNAAKYTNAGGAIWLSVEPSAAGNEVLIRVRDTGRGIDALALKNLFELFYQVDRTLDRSDGGLGIGLSLVKNLVEMHGGRVEAHSAGRGQGSEFIVHLPCLPPVAPPGQTDASDVLEPSAHGHRILLVEDNLDVAESMSMLLSLYGYQVLIARDGRQGVEMALRERPGVVLMDIGLPYLDGYQACRAMREGGLADTLIVALSGYSQEDDLRKAEQAGFDRHLAKPLDPEALEQLLASLSGRAA